HQCIFIHIPKCAGMSIEKALGFNVKKIHEKDTIIKHGNLKQWKHPLYTDKYFVFTLVRNPYDRLLSAIFFDLKQSFSPQKKNKNNRRETIKKIITQNGIIKGCRIFINNELKKHIDDVILYKSQLFWINSGVYDYIGRVENINKYWKTICKYINIDYKKLPHINKTKNQQIKKIYDKETRNVVHNIYKRDFKELDF
ncbi:MAG: sulfotransferase family 2 domain-containing protein, partial [Atribacterota bacterium]